MDFYSILQHVKQRISTIKPKKERDLLISLITPETFKTTEYLDKWLVQPEVSKLFSNIHKHTTTAEIKPARMLLNNPRMGLLSYNRKTGIRFQLHATRLYKFNNWSYYTKLKLSDTTEIGEAARYISHGLFDIPHIWTGFASKQVTSLTKATPEHFYPRKFCGTLMIHHCIKHGYLYFDEFIRMVRVASQVHYVTSSENQKLRKNQLKMPWKELYNYHGIELDQHRWFVEVLPLTYGFSQDIIDMTYDFYS